MTFHSRGALSPTSPLFRGRQAELTRLLQLCHGDVTAYVIVYGGRQTGKTSLLLRLERRLQDTVRVCRVNFQSVPGATAAQVYTFLARRVAQTVPLSPDPTPVSDPQTLTQFLTQALDRPEISRLVVLLDELGTLPDRTRDDLANVLRALFHDRLIIPALAKLQVVLTGGIELYNLVIAEVSALHNICEEIYLGDLSEADAIALVADGLEPPGIPRADGAQMGRAIYAWVQGHPYLTQRLGYLLELTIRRSASLAPASVDQAVQQVEQSDPLLGHLRRSLREQGLEVAAQRLLTAPPRFSRFDDDLARLELLGLAKEVHGRWGIRNPLIAAVVREWLELDPLPMDQGASSPAGVAAVQPGQLVRLREILVARFNNDELRTLCFDLGIDYDNLGGEGKAGKARELVAFLERRGGTADLIALGQRLRPDADWGVPPEAPSTPADPTAFAEPAPTSSTPAPAPQPAPSLPSAPSIPDEREPDGADVVHETEREAAPPAAPVAQPTPPNPARDRQQATDPVTPTPPQRTSPGRKPADKITARASHYRTLLLALVVLPLLVAGTLLTVREWPVGDVAVVPTTPTTTPTTNPTVPIPIITPPAGDFLPTTPPATMTTTPTPSATDAPASEPGIVAVPIGTTDQVMEFVEIPAGSFLMGSHVGDPVADDDEKPQHELTLDSYWIGKTPVTNAQFRPFVEGDGYTNQDYWTEAGWQWKEEEGIVQPRFWDDTEWNGDDYPVVGISWFEAVAYARWVSAQTGEELRLPTEAEWEKAARGPEGLIWPWGNEWVAGRANSEDARIGKTTPVGSYPDGASPYGVLDMAGNVWEWTATKWRKDYPYTLEDEWTEAYLAGDAVRMIRGGSWMDEQRHVRGANRNFSDYDPHDRVRNNGLRLASHSLSPTDGEE
jgi:formylglycine-generating enzyme required for sulfatase activity